MLKDKELRDNRRTHQARQNIAMEQMASALEQTKPWDEQTRLAEQQISIQENNVKIFANLLLERDEGFRQDPARKRERRAGSHIGAAVETSKRGRSR
jgi:hypothetical protein